MHVNSKSELANWVLLCDKFTKGKNKRLPHKKFQLQSGTDWLHKGNVLTMSNTSSNIRKKWGKKNKRSTNNRNRSKKKKSWYIIFPVRVQNLKIILMINNLYRRSLTYNIDTFLKCGLTQISM